MTDPPGPQRQEPLREQDLAAGEKYAPDHDPGPAEQYAGDPVPDPWEEQPDGQLDSGAVPGLPA
ncbi:hypothetical protein [Pseudosporangium ferrugineum]|uniref:Uncharacterized protein n=1 Tax=Pseudosporangium ferrugineum TaxID=439699 RepID=A0A2T0RNZ9_9ACTN|nr:hypothetical protein [Pseudosporangium ferrugineum]PRY22871.1 hypothetical protein CLV70_116131 [Pseudosporangium ferrugineum]